ncbi:NAC domain-containing protein JA2-like [Mercurialis annua]|uniref:NAC domain-containing protein JA2-like n=1 Tax=Mercurialis annua TaxID=3986 RepID=UPI00215DDA92|nr:NAC domain-containing protein JA2-like [Mercurialis annua]
MGDDNVKETSLHLPQIPKPILHCPSLDTTTPMSDGEKVMQIKNSVCGMRFCPNDYELVCFSLIPRIFGYKPPLDIIQELDVYNTSPDNLPVYEFEYSTHGQAYFFTEKVMKKSKTKRTAGDGYWKVAGGEKCVTDNRKKQCVGYTKTMVFHRGKAPKGEQTKWVMDEIRVNASLYSHTERNEGLDLKMKKYVVCRIRDRELVKDPDPYWD